VIEAVALAVVATTGVFFLVLGSASLVAPQRAGRFLSGFAGSAWKHYLELALRILSGSAFVLAAPRLPCPVVFGLFGWLLVGTTAVLIFVPWHWHRRFAQRVVPGALRLLPLVGMASIVAGGLVLSAVVLGR
jgi:hypothetical protein